MFERFLKRLAKDIFNANGRDTDHPKCPQCGQRMTFHGGDLEYGDGYWDCKGCDFTFTEDELNQYL